MNEIRFIDTTVRDGQLSLWALGMKTGAMLAIAEQMDRCGFESMEFFGFAGYIKMVREHKENPWDWMGLGAKKFRRTRLRYHGGLATGFENTALGAPADDRARGGARHHADALLGPVERLRSRGARDRGAEKARHGRGHQHHLFGMPRHTDEYYAERARQAAAIQPYRICFKDVGGLLTPDRARTLIPLIQQNIDAVPLEFHAHCNNGMAPFNLSRGDKARRRHPAHGDTAAGQGRRSRRFLTSPPTPARSALTRSSISSDQTG